MSKTARLISFSDYIKPGNLKHVLNNLSYSATRENVELNPKEYIQKESLPESFSVHPVSPKQQMMINSILKEAPTLKEKEEYESFKQNSNMYSASVFITESMKEIAEQELTNPEYLNYISYRKGVEKNDEMNHGLFDATGSANLEQIEKELADHEGKGNVWRDILSLRREDAAELGYDHQSSWRSLLQAKMPIMAEKMGIPLNDFRWCAAFHNEGHHPHVHIMFWDQTGKNGFLKKDGLEAFKSACANEIFSNEMYLAKELKTIFREDIQTEFKEHIDNVIKKANQGLSDNEVLKNTILEKIEALSQMLPEHGRMQYGYMPKEIKVATDEIVGDILTSDNVKPLLKEYLIQDTKLCEFYKKIDEGFITERLNSLIHPQKKDRKVLHNLVIKSATELRNIRLEDMFINHEVYNKAITAIQKKDICSDIKDADREALCATICKVASLHHLPAEETLIYTEPVTDEINALEIMLDVKNKSISRYDLYLLNKYYDIGIDENKDYQNFDHNKLFAINHLFSNFLNFMSTETVQKEIEINRLKKVRAADEAEIRISNIKRNMNQRKK